MTNHAILYDVLNVKLQLYAKALVRSWGGGKHFSKTFSIFYVLNNKNRVFNSYFFILHRYLSYEKNTFADKLRVEPTIRFMEKV